MEDPSAALPFIGQILGALRAEVGNEATVLGFVGAPWTLAAYAIEGGSSRQEPVLRCIWLFTASRIEKFYCKCNPI